MSGIAHLPLLLARKIVRSFFDQKKSRHIFLAAVSLILSTLTCFATAAPSSPIPPPDLRVIYKALGLKVSDGKLINACDEIVQPEIEAIDLNADGKSEVFVTMTGLATVLREPNCHFSSSTAKDSGTSTFPGV